MANYLLAWNPKKWRWEELPEFVDAFNRGEVMTHRWSCGNNKQIAEGDRVWLIRLGKEPRGIFGCGTVIAPSYEDVRWNDSSKTTQYIECQIESIINPETDRLFSREQLSQPPFDVMHWDTQVSGVRIPDAVAIALREEWSRRIGGGDFALPEEISTTQTYNEGTVRLVAINSFERSSLARTKCIAHYGTRCYICDFKFSEKYGPVGEGLIHVHHLIPLAESRESCEVDPIEHLRPVCPNCHAIIHARNPQYSIEEVKRMLEP